jgi:tetratricopeptide (TPR) repeat protein
MAAVSPALRDGIAAAQAQQFETARPLLERATAEQPDDPIGWFWLAIVSQSADAAIPCLRRVLAIDGTHAQAREALAKLLIAQAGAAASAGNRTAARELASEATELTPGAHSVWVAFAALSDDQNDRIKALRQASALSGDDLQIRTRLRQALLCRALLIAQTERVEARALFTEAAALDPDDARVWGALANLADSPGESLAPLR